MATDKEVADAMRDLEDDVYALHCMSSVLQTVFDEAIMDFHAAQKCFGIAAPREGYRVFVMTDKQHEGLSYAWSHHQDLTRRVYDGFHAAHDGRTLKRA